MLPFLKKKDQTIAGLMIKHRTPDEDAKADQDDGDQDNSSAAIESCAQALITAVHAKDVKAVSDALKDAFDILESTSSDDEGGAASAEEKHTYDAQNIKAAKQARE